MNRWEPDGSPLAFVLSRNLHRRHLDESQRAVVASKAKELFKDEAAQREREHQFGRRRKTPPGEAVNGQKPRISTASANLPTPRGTDVKVAKMFNVSARSVRSANRVLASGDAQVVAAVEDGSISVSDAAAIVKLAKPRQRELLALVRSKKARTLRAAARMKKPKTLPEEVLRSHPCDPRAMRGRVRRACRFFLAEFETYRGYIEMAADGCDRDNVLIQRARDGLAAAHSAMQECLARHGYANSGSQSTIH